MIKKLFEWSKGPSEFLWMTTEGYNYTYIIDGLCTVRQMQIIIIHLSCIIYRSGVYSPYKSSFNIGEIGEKIIRKRRRLAVLVPQMRRVSNLQLLWSSLGHVHFLYKIIVKSFRTWYNNSVPICLVLSFMYKKNTLFVFWNQRLQLNSMFPTVQLFGHLILPLNN